MSVKITEYHCSIGLNMLCAVIADLHDEVSRYIIESIEKNQPKCIFLVGDVVNRSSIILLDSTIAFLQKCVCIAPTYYSFGNHERMLLSSEIETIKSLGVQVLDNTWQQYNNCVIGGLSTGMRGEIKECDIVAFRRNTELRRTMPYFSKRRHLADDVSTKLIHHCGEPELDWIKDYVAQDRAKILLCHHPEYYDRYLKGMDIDLIISGHAHGGQVRFFGQGLYSPGQGLFPRYTSGVYDRKLIVSRGLSNTMKWVPRLFNSKELVYLHV